MYQVVLLKKYQKSLKKIQRSGKFSLEIIEKVIDTLATGEDLSSQYKDHQLKGELSNYRECHIQNDLLLVYQIKQDMLILVLIDIGSHSYLFD